MALLKIRDEMIISLSQAIISKISYDRTTRQLIRIVKIEMIKKDLM
jgi:hypothetical protein